MQFQAVVLQPEQSEIELIKELKESELLLKIQELPVVQPRAASTRYKYKGFKIQILMSWNEDYGSTQPHSQIPELQLLLS